MIIKTHLHWFNLKCPYPRNSKEYAAAKRRLEGATYPDLEKLRAEFDEFDDGSIPVIFFRKGNQWLCSIGSPPDAQNLKGIQPHGRRFRVQKRVDGDIRKWSFDNLHEAIKKRDAIFA